MLPELLTTCARPECRLNPQNRLALAEQARDPQAWGQLVFQAEWHGLGALLYAHLRAAAVDLPPDVKHRLQGLYLRHRWANQVRSKILVEILARFQSAGIQTLVLKGAALAQLIYPEPGLRAMGDIDLLVKKSEARRAQQLLAEAGFNAPLDPGPDLPDKHLIPAHLPVEGFMVTVEVHHNLFRASFPASLEFDTLRCPPLAFDLNGTMAYTLGYEEMLWHLCCHTTQMIHLALRLIWVADIVGFAERFAAEIDWDQIARDYPLVLSCLTQFHYLVPLSDTLRQAAGLDVDRTPQGVGLDFQGWPRYPLAQQRQKGLGRLVADSFWPSEWWLRLHYGIRSPVTLAWYRWAGHPLQILSLIAQLFQEKVGWRQAI